MMLTTSCSDEANDRAVMTMPLNFPAVEYDLKKNPITNNGFELGRSLFYDPILSRDGSISCGNCHIQSAAFSHRGHIVSHGINDLLGTRNAPAMANLAWQKDFFWDGGVSDLDLQPIGPIENPVEMDDKVLNVLQKLRAHPTYPDRFNEVFGSKEILTEHFLKALSQFMITLVSSNSRYDKYIRNEGEMLSDDELDGMKLVQQKCSPCHSSDLFTDQTYRNNGLDQSNKTDEGRYIVTLNQADKFKFRVPTLRNAEVTAPYMHDGRFRNLELVLDHYANGVENNATLDTLLKQGGILGISLTSEEKRKIIAFIETLTDHEFLTNRRFEEQQ
jgi:cytochrome c peroxidase